MSKILKKRKITIEIAKYVRTFVQVGIVFMVGLWSLCFPPWNKTWSFIMWSYSEVTWISTIVKYKRASKFGRFFITIICKKISVPIIPAHSTGELPPDSAWTIEVKQPKLTHTSKMTYIWQLSRWKIKI